MQLEVSRPPQTPPTSQLLPTPTLPPQLPKLLPTKHTSRLRPRPQCRATGRRRGYAARPSWRASARPRPGELREDLFKPMGRGEAPLGPQRGVVQLGTSPFFFFFSGWSGNESAGISGGTNTNHVAGSGLDALKDVRLEPETIAVRRRHPSDMAMGQQPVPSSEHPSPHENRFQHTLYRHIAHVTPKKLKSCVFKR